MHTHTHTLALLKTLISFPYLGLVCWRRAAALVALRVHIGGWGVCAQVGLWGQASSVLLGPRGHLHGCELSCIQLLQGQRAR